ncbi:hydrolase [Flexivirga endophytica]|uniref:Hydrolase n=1 Tax=Flexivirga endophytica TaxID=1849103 RepID=A0A916TIB7_9MICO|nr:HIT family protein [Flexivirga endophytica]GGB46728.1 hydrolase [Flexivirga endophytica]GHB70783.1 hydrolase [Flexivirga endophytica]
METSRWRHEPVGYRCPFCAFQRGEWNDRNAASDLVVQRELVFARIAPKWWPENAGGALVIPNEHVENLYELPTDVGHALWDLTREVAIGMRETYGCQGVSTRQHNEPAGDQDVWHLHLHVLPRYDGDDLYLRHRAARYVDAAERADFAARLSDALG